MRYDGFSPVFSVALLALAFVAGCTRVAEDIYVVQQTDVELGNIMYTDGEDGMYDIWYNGITLTNGLSTIHIALDGSEPNHAVLTSLSVGDRVEITSDLSALQLNLLDAYWANDIEIARLE